MKPTLPVCLYPTTTMIVDDNYMFLESLENRIRLTEPCIAFSSPKHVLEYAIDGMQKHDKYFKSPSLSNSASVRTHYLEPNRFHEVTLMVTDYQMPYMDGLTLCNKLTGIPLHKIMLTGEADNQIAVNAFNQKAIDAFVKKSTTEFADEMMDNITNFRFQYFVDQSRELISQLHQQDHHPISACFFDEAFAEWFKAFLIEHQIVECYLYSTPANFMLINEPGDIFWLSIANDAELEEELDWAEDQYEDAEDLSAKPLIEAIKAKQRILFFPNHHDNIQPLTFPEWESIAHPCEKLALENGNTYYYAFFADKAPYTMKQVSFKTYGMYLDEVLG